MRNPLNKAYRVSSPYGHRILGGSPDFHNGVDLVPFDGKHPTDIVAVADGTVTGVRTNVPDTHTGLRVTTMVTGNFVNIRTKEGFTVIFRHLKANSIPAHIKVGATVRAGDKIGVMGNTGQSTGTHLHYEIRDTQNLSVNPARYLDNNVPLPSANASETAVDYAVRVNDNLNVRSGPGTNFPVVRTIRDNGVYHIIAEADGAGAKRWGRLHSGEGWVSLDFTSRMSEPAPPPAPSSSEIRVGSRVRVGQGARTYTGGSVAAFVYDRSYTVDFLTGDRAVLDARGLCTPFNVRDLIIA